MLASAEISAGICPQNELYVKSKDLADPSLAISVGRVPESDDPDRSMLVIAVKFPISLGMLPVKYWLLIVRAVSAVRAPISVGIVLVNRFPWSFLIPGMVRFRRAERWPTSEGSVPGALDAPS